VICPSPITSLVSSIFSHSQCVAIRPVESYEVDRVLRCKLHIIASIKLLHTLSPIISKEGIPIMLGSTLYHHPFCTQNNMHLNRVMDMVFKGTFNNILIISWRSVLFVEKTGVPKENHLPATSH
jgi:hypothetical protein